MLKSGALPLTFMIALLAYKKRFALVKYLYRILAVAAITLPLFAPSTCAAQKKARARIPALAVLELPATVPMDKDLKIPATPRLHAISTFQTKTYQAAPIYYVNPGPMALEPGTVYSVPPTG